MGGQKNFSSQYRNIILLTSLSCFDRKNWCKQSYILITFPPIWKITIYTEILKQEKSVDFFTHFKTRDFLFFDLTQEKFQCWKYIITFQLKTKCTQSHDQLFLQIILENFRKQRSFVFLYYFRMRSNHKYVRKSCPVFFLVTKF